MKRTLAEKSSRRPEQLRPGAGAEEGEGSDLDLISCLPDDVLRDIITRLASKEGARTQILSRRWRPLWGSAPLNLEAAVTGIGGKAHERVVDSILSALLAHKGPVRRLSLDWSFDHSYFPVLDCVLGSPMLDVDSLRVQEFERLLGVPSGPAVRGLPPLADSPRPQDLLGP